MGCILIFFFLILWSLICFKDNCLSCLARLCWTAWICPSTGCPWRGSAGENSCCRSPSQTLGHGYIFPINWIFLPPPLFQDHIFFSPSTVKISPFSRFSTPFPNIFAFLLNKPSYFFPNQLKTHIFANDWQNEKYIPLPPPLSLQVCGKIFMYSKE